MNKIFKWPQPIVLEKKLKDLLEPKVDEKYYLSGAKIDAISKWNAQQDPFVNMEKTDKTGIVPTLTTRDGDEQSGMKLVKEYIKREEVFSTFEQENHTTSKDDEHIPTLTSTGAFSRHKIIENVFESNHHGGKVHDPEKIAPTFKENHGNGLFIKEATKKGYKEAHDGDGVYIANMKNKRGTVQKDMIQTIKTQPDVGVVVKDHGNYISLKDGKGRFNTQDHRAWKGDKMIGTIATNDRFTPKMMETETLKIRKITPREALRLMGLDDKRIDLIQESKLVPHNKQYFIAGNSIVVQVMEAIFKNIDFPKDRPLKVFETFAGYGSQSIALENLGYEVDAHTSEWYVDAIIAYALLHHNHEFNNLLNSKYFKDLVAENDKDGKWQKEYWLDKLEQWTLSTDSKKPSNLKSYSNDKLRALYHACVVNNNKGSILDIKGVDLDQYDLLTYSFPCQDLSQAGKGKGMSKEDNTRSGLLWEIERILDELNVNGKLPKVLLMENVPPLVGKKHKSDFDAWLNKLHDLGYATTWKILNAKDYGIPQNRARVFAVSILGGEVEQPASIQISLDI